MDMSRFAQQMHIFFRNLNFGCLVLLLAGGVSLSFGQVVIPPNTEITVPKTTPTDPVVPDPRASPFIIPPGTPNINPGQQGAQQPAFSEILGEAELAPAKSIRRLPPLWPYYLGASIAAFLLLSALIIWILLRNRKPKPVPIIPADVRALSGLEALRPLIREAKAREFSYQASEIIRGYIEDRFGVKTRNRTTREFLSESLASERTISEKHKGSLQQFLNYCDLAKFAKQVLSPEQLSEMFNSASQFIKETRPSIMAVSGEAPVEARKEVVSK